jgi:hypothetical protein
MEQDMQKIREQLNINVVVGDRIGSGYGNITAGKITDAELQEVGEQAPHYLVGVTKEAPSCCIDGRTCLYCMDREPTEPRPSVAGGAAVTSHAAAELAGWFEANDPTDSNERVAMVVQQLALNGIKSGGHCDLSAYEAAFEGGKTGCGAADKEATILKIESENHEAISQLVESLWGERYANEHMAFTDKEVVQARVADLRAKAVVELLSGNDPHAIEVLASDDSDTHGHKEVAVVFNFIEGTTIDRDKFFEETGRQVFVVDMWYIDTLAQAMARGPEKEQQTAQLLHAMTAYQIATYLTLCDGSQPPIILQ